MEKIKLLHGGGGEAMQGLIEGFVSNFSNIKVEGGLGLDAFDDSATIPLGDSFLVFTTDSYTVKPLFFPGGDIGCLSISGTVNDLAMMGAKPLALSSAFIIGEGLSVESLDRISKSMNRVCEEVPVPIVTGDTKVIENIDMVINTAGIGLCEKPIRDAGLQKGDRLIVSGTLGDHGITIMAEREGISFDTSLVSDCAQLWGLVEDIKGFDIHAMKDPTRGGLANAVNEMAEKSGLQINLIEEDIPLRDEVKAASEMLGIDPLSVANEGKAVIGVAAEDAEDVLEILKKNPLGRDAAIIGEVVSDSPGRVVMETVIGGRKILAKPASDPVPRVC